MKHLQRLLPAWVLKGRSGLLFIWLCSVGLLLITWKSKLLKHSLAVWSDDILRSLPTVPETSNFTTSSNTSPPSFSPAHLAVPPLAFPVLSFSCAVNYSSILAGHALPRHRLHRLWMCVQPCDENARTVWFKAGRGSDSLRCWAAVALRRPISLLGRWESSGSSLMSTWGFFCCFFNTLQVRTPGNSAKTLLHSPEISGLYCLKKSPLLLSRYCCK